MTRSIYIIKSEPGPVKIGISDKPKKRFHSIQTASAVPLSLEYVGVGSAASVVALIETTAHEILRNKHQRGEWFSVPIEDAVGAVLKAANQLGFTLQTPAPEISRRGRPATGHDPVTSIRLSPEIRAEIEAWAARQEDKPPLSEAIRRLIEAGLKGRK